MIIECMHCIVIVTMICTTHIIVTFYSLLLAPLFKPLKHLLLSSKARRVHFTKFLPNICDIQTRCVCVYILHARAGQAYHVNIMYPFVLSCLGIDF